MGCRRSRARPPASDSPSGERPSAQLYRCLPSGAVAPAGSSALGRNSAAPLLPASGDYGLPRTSTHPPSESVLLLPAPGVWLIGPFHSSASFVSRLAPSLTGLAHQAAKSSYAAASLGAVIFGARWGNPRCPGTLRSREHSRRRGVSWRHFFPTIAC